MCDGNCNKGTCGSCAGKGDGEGACNKAGRLIGKRRLLDWRRCESFCDNGCGPRASLLTTAELEAMRERCCKWGPHANAARRQDDISPTDAEAIASAFEYAPATFDNTDATTPNAVQAVPGYAGWYVGISGALLISHKFCVTEVSATYQVAGAGARVNLPVTNVRIAGARIACNSTLHEPSLSISAGSYVWVMDRSRGADPGDIDTTPERCACKNLCAWTPARGLEFYMVEFNDGVTLTAGELATVIVKVKVERCDWLVEVDPCVTAQGNRLPFSAFSPIFVAPLGTDLVPFTRVDPANIPALP